MIGSAVGSSPRVGGIWRIDNPGMRRIGEAPAISASSTIPGLREPLEFRILGAELTEVRSEAFLAAAVMPAMKTGVDLEMAGPISPMLRLKVATIQDIYSSWDPTLHRIAVHAPPVSSTRPPGKGVAAFFSGGVDSFYTALKHRDEITSLVLVHGFDMPLADTPLRTAVSQAMRVAAADLGKTLIEVETNIRGLAELHDINWNWYHGSALASVALLLAPLFERFYIPASYPYFWLEPWGSHPLLDPLWRTENLDIVHDGCEATRTQKVRSIATSSVALRSLRVCWERPDGARNCGRCEKCVRTMLNLECAGALASCATFDRPLDPKVVARVEMRDESALMFGRDNLRACETQGVDPALVSALRAALSRTYYRGLGKLLRGDITARLARRLRRGTHWPTDRTGRQSAYAFARGSS